jgi:hypothetical protein
LAWGGHYKKRKDEMHFDIKMNKEQVKQKIKQLGLS